MAVLLRCFIFDDGYSPNLHPMICSIFIESFVLKTSDWLMKNWYKVSFGIQSFSVEIETKLLSRHSSNKSYQCFPRNSSQAGFFCAIFQEWQVVRTSGTYLEFLSSFSLFFAKKCAYGKKWSFCQIPT